MKMSPVQDLDVDRIGPDRSAFLAKIVNLIPGVIYIFNQDTGCNEYSNRSIASLLGYSREDVLEMGDQMMATIIKPEDLAPMAAHFAALKGVAAGDCAVFEYRARAKEGHWVWLRSFDTVFERSKDGSVVRHLGVAFDITAEKHTQDRLTAANRELEERVAARTLELSALNRELEARVAERTAKLMDVNRELEQLAHVATHDLKVPVNNMSSLANMLTEAESHLPQEHVETLGWMHDVCAQARDKLDSLIWVTQLATREFGPLEDVSLPDAMDAVLAKLRNQLHEAKANVTADFSECGQIKFLPQEFESMMEKLVSNGLKYASPDRSPHIVVRGFRDAGMACISVADNGTGLKLPEDEGKVFGLFQRAHTCPEGTGVGLYTIRRMMDKVDGNISVTANAPVGCVFTLRFPDTPLNVEKTA